MSKFEFNDLANCAQNHLIHVVSASKDKEALLVNLAKYYTTLVMVLREKYP